jgi:glucose uptake protein GlcU
MSIDPAAHEPNRSRRTTVARRAPPVGVSLGALLLPVVVILVASYPVVTAAALTGLFVGLTWSDLTDGR